MLARRFRRRRELRPRIKDPLAARLMELRHTQEQIRRRGLAITEQPEMTAKDRAVVEELISLLYEIEDFAERLKRAGEKWRLK
jgi:hypothetical protein